MVIRRETPADHRVIDSLVKKTFKSAEHAGGDEHEPVKAPRKGRAYIPALSLVAEIGEKSAGHIMFTKAQVGNAAVLALAPPVRVAGISKTGLPNKRARLAD